MKEKSYYLKRSSDICISRSNLKAKYYDPVADKLDIDAIRKDIAKIKIDIDTLVNGDALYVYDSKANKYTVLFRDLELEYIHLLRLRLDALESFEKDLDPEEIINIPDYIKRKKKSEEK